MLTLGARDFSSAVSGFCQVFIVNVSALGQHRKFPPHARKTSGTQGRECLKLTKLKSHKLLGTRLHVTLSETKIQGKFIVERSPWWGGFYEECI